MDNNVVQLFPERRKNKEHGFKSLQELIEFRISVIDKYLVSSPEEYAEEIAKIPKHIYFAIANAYISATYEELLEECILFNTQT